LNLFGSYSPKLASFLDVLDAPPLAAEMFISLIRQYFFTKEVYEERSGMSRGFWLHGFCPQIGSASIEVIPLFLKELQAGIRHLRITEYAPVF
jgi:hypothetical protein